MAASSESFARTADIAAELLPVAIEQLEHSIEDFERAAAPDDVPLAAMMPRLGPIVDRLVACLLGTASETC